MLYTKLLGIQIQKRKPSYIMTKISKLKALVFLCKTYLLDRTEILRPRYSTILRKTFMQKEMLWTLKQNEEKITTYIREAGYRTAKTRL